MNKIFKISWLILAIFIFGIFFTAHVQAEDAPADPQTVVETDPPTESEIIPDSETIPEENTGGQEANLLIEKDVVLGNSCTIEDAEGNSHTFPQEDSPSEYLAICVLAEALEQEFITGFEIINNPDFGLYVQSVNGREPSNTQFWSLWHNGAFANCGIGCLAISENDILSLILTDWMTETESDTISLHISSLASDPDDVENGEEEIDGEQKEAEPAQQESQEQQNSSGGGGNSDISALKIFDAETALAYLKGVQQTDGSFGEQALYTDWAAVAFGAMEESGSAYNSLLGYFSANNSVSSLITDNERRAMSLLALGQNPYSFHGVNYIESIIADFDGAQFGDADLVNDDIFALIPLASAGYGEEDIEIVKAVSFIISEQRTDGSWENSIDVTAAAVQALKLFDNSSGTEEVISKAEDYLKNSQNEDGGWDNIFSTSWALQAENALGASWTNAGKNGLDYLATMQTADGAVSSSLETLVNKIWATSYAIPAGLGKPWDDILQSVSRPETSKSESDSRASSNSPSENPAETLNPPTPAEPVTCPEGDLFSTTTGRACTVFTPIVVEPVLETNIIKNPSTRDKPVIQITPDISKDKTVTEETSTEMNGDELGALALTANAGNSLPTSNKVAENLPIVIATAAGAVLLFAVGKFFIL